VETPISRKQAFGKLRTRKDCSLHRTRRSIAIGRYIPEDVQNSFHVGPTEEVTFTQLTATLYAYRDAVHFKNGRELLLQRLNERQRVKVVQLSVADEAGQPVWNAVEGSWF